MAELSLVLVGAAFLSGFLMFLAPCTLPLVPAYLAFISGVSERGAQAARRKILINATGFCVGFTLVFVSFGLLAGFFGTFVGSLRGILLPVGGLFIFIFGLLMLGLLRLPILSRDHAVRIPQFCKPGNPIGAAAIGATFALGWSPCIGPVLATILLLASLKTTVLSGGLLLLIFSIGLSVPFILTALFYSGLSAVLARQHRLTRVINLMGGGVLVALGVLLMFDAFDVFVSYGQDLFYYLGLEALFEYL